MAIMGRKIHNNTLVIVSGRNWRAMQCGIRYDRSLFTVNPARRGLGAIDEGVDLVVVMVEIIGDKDLGLQCSLVT